MINLKVKGKYTEWIYNVQINDNVTEMKTNSIKGDKTSIIKTLDFLEELNKGYYIIIK